jgi:hypothetical protein
MFRCFKKPISVEKAIKEMRQVEAVLQDMIYKYERIKTETKIKFKEEATKRRKLMHLKRIKTLDHHITQCEAKLIACVNKQYALEQLEITKMQIEAIKSSTSIFKSFSKYNPLHKIEDLQETMEERLEDLADITDLLTSGTVEFDEDELLAELNDIEGEQIVEEMPEVPTNIPRHPDRIAVPI